jgi:hypothetical protein
MLRMTVALLPTVGQAQYAEIKAGARIKFATATMTDTSVIYRVIDRRGDSVALGNDANPLLALDVSELRSVRIEDRSMRRWGAVLYGIVGGIIGYSVARPGPCQGYGCLNGLFAYLAASAGAAVGAGVGWVMGGGEWIALTPP